MTFRNRQLKSFDECAYLVRDSVLPKEAIGSPYIGLEHIGEGTLSLADHGRAENVKSVKSRFQRGDILFGKLRPYFRKVIRAPFNGVCSTDIWVVRARQGVDQGFLFYCMSSPEFIEFSTRGSEGTKMPRAKWEFVSKFKIGLPPLPEQRAIAHILGSLDDKIELNRRMNETLEQMARALFKAWFVDFEPVRAKMEGRWKRGQSLPGLPAQLYDLFPNRLVDSKLGKIPEGWNAVPLAEIIDINPPRRLRKGCMAPYLDMANMPIRIHTPDELVIRPFTSGVRFINGDTLLARITPCFENGKAAFVDFLQEGQVGWGSTEYIVLRPKPSLPEEFAYYLARSQDFRKFAMQCMTGTSGRQRVQTEALLHYMLVSPPESIAKVFGRVAKQVLMKISVAVKECRSLSTLRDMLLPKLVRGEIRVKDLKHFSKEFGL